MPHGFFGTRADALIDLSIILLSLLPVSTWIAIGYARKRRWTAHRNLQTATFLVNTLAVALLEIDIRISGGTVAYLSRSALPLPLMRACLLSHIAIALVTFCSWGILVVISWRRLHRVLPGDFSPRHRRVGKLTFAGITLMSSSGIALYVLLYVM
jgi:uncharacterized membrane protein YozB (DUF420 family)